MANSTGLMAPHPSQREWLWHRTKTVRLKLCWKIFNFDRYLAALGLIPSGICRLLAKAVNPSNSKAGRLAEKTHVSRLSHVIFTSAFGMWMERKRREMGWKARDKVDSKKDKNSSIDDKQSKDGSAQVGVRRSARISKRKMRA